MKLSKYQINIFNALKDGAKLQCTEGANYKSWLVMPTGKIIKVRRDSAEKVSIVKSDLLVFGESTGIRLRKL